MGGGGGHGQHNKPHKSGKFAGKSARERHRQAKGVLCLQAHKLHRFNHGPHSCACSHFSSSSMVSLASVVLHQVVQCPSLCGGVLEGCCGVIGQSGAVGGSAPPLPHVSSVLSSVKITFPSLHVQPNVLSGQLNFYKSWEVLHDAVFYPGPLSVPGLLSPSLTSTLVLPQKQGSPSAAPLLCKPARPHGRMQQSSNVTRRGSRSWQGDAAAGPHAWLHCSPFRRLRPLSFRGTAPPVTGFFLSHCSPCVSGCVSFPLVALPSLSQVAPPLPLIALLPLSQVAPHLPLTARPPRCLWLRVRSSLALLPSQPFKEPLKLLHFHLQPTSPSYPPTCLAQYRV